MAEDVLVTNDVPVEAEVTPMSRVEYAAAEQEGILKITRTEVSVQTVPIAKLTAQRDALARQLGMLTSRLQADIDRLTAQIDAAQAAGVTIPGSSSQLRAIS